MATWGSTTTRCFFWIMITLASIAQSTDGNTNPEDVRALLAFYDNLNSPPHLHGWTQSNHGKSESDPCSDSWDGITCDLDGKWVTHLELPSLNLNSSDKLDWSSSLHRFQHLRVLDLSSNKFRGQIPSNLPNGLRVLNLQHNELIRNIPWQLGQLQNLTELKLAHNNLTGPIANNFAKLLSLTTLDLSDNGFTGTIPQSMGKLPNLTSLYLQDNKIESGLNVLAGLSLLRTLNIRQNAFKEDEEIPDALLNIPSLQYSHDEFKAPAPDAHNEPKSNESSPAASPPAPPPQDLEATPPPPPEHERPAHSPHSPHRHHPDMAGSPQQDLEEDPQDVDDGNATAAAAESDHHKSTFWTPVRVAGFAGAGMLGLVTIILTVLYIRWRRFEAEIQADQEEEDVIHHVVSRKSEIGSGGGSRQVKYR